jgi:hypothetical protein
MIRPLAVIALAAVTSLPLAAQAPKGWKERIDRSTSANDPDGTGNIQFVVEGAGYHATNPAAAVFWNPTNTAKGEYTLKGTFTLLKPSGHSNYYGLVFGGGDLEGATQHYAYFVVAQDGTWLIKQRTGDDRSLVTTIAPKTPNDAVKKPDASGRSVNALEVRVRADKVEFAVNGTVVHSMPKSGLSVGTDGIYGIRINHLLDVQIDQFGTGK